LGGVKDGKRLTKECRQPLDVEKFKEVNSSLETSKPECSPKDTGLLTFRTGNEICSFKPLRLWLCVMAATGQ
jgi:hypothetical protein